MRRGVALYCTAKPPLLPGSPKPIYLSRNRRDAPRSITGNFYLIFIMPHFFPFPKRAARFSFAPLIACAVLTAPMARAVIVFRGDGRNVSPPSGDLAQSGWQYEGLWNGFTGTVIGPHQFITATHVGGQVGALFEIGGKKYPAVGWTPIPNSDMTLWWVAGTFPGYAPLYTTSDEVKKPLVLFGRGTRRGAALRIDGETRGWRWGANDKRLSWGKNRVVGITNFGAGGSMARDESAGDWLGGGIDNPQKPLGEMLLWGFVQNNDLDTGTVSGGDSGGGVFIKDGKTWKLAGVIHGTDRGFRRSLPPDAGSAAFRAAVFEARGLFRASDNSLVGAWGSGDDDRPLTRCSIGYACRVSAHQSDIQAALSAPPRSRRIRRLLALSLACIVGFIGIAAFAAAFLVRHALVRREKREEAALLRGAV